MKIEEKIIEMEEGLKTAEASRSALVSSHLNQINSVIEKKILEMKDELRQYGIDTVCGEEYKVLTEAIENYKKGIDTLKKIVEDPYLRSVMGSLSEAKEEAPAANAEAAETEHQEEPTQEVSGNDNE